MRLANRLFGPFDSPEQMFYARALRLTLSSFLILLFVCSLLGFGAYIFVNAAAFTANDVSSSGVDTQIDTEEAKLGDLTRKQQAASVKMSALQNKDDVIFQNKFKTLVDSLPRRPCAGTSTTGFNVAQPNTSQTEMFDNAKKSIEAAYPTDKPQNLNLVLGLFVGRQSFCLSKQDALYIIDELRQTDYPDLASYGVLNKEISALTSDLQFEGQVIEGLKKRKVEEHVYGHQRSPEVGTKDLALSLAQTSITRFGTLAIISFLVAILIPLYRYNMKLSAFYAARGDAYRLKREGDYDFNLEKMLNVLTPEYDFGRTPRTPSEQVVDLVRALRATDKG